MRNEVTILQAEASTEVIEITEGHKVHSILVFFFLVSIQIGEHFN